MVCCDGTPNARRSVAEQFVQLLLLWLPIRIFQKSRVNAHQHETLYSVFTKDIPSPIIILTVASWRPQSYVFVDFYHILTTDTLDMKYERIICHIHTLHLDALLQRALHAKPLPSVHLQYG